MDKGCQAQWISACKIYAIGHRKLPTRLEKFQRFHQVVHGMEGQPGEYRHQKIHAELVKSLGHDSRNTFIMEIGEVLELNEESAKVTGVVPSGQVFIDGLGVGDVGNIVLRDRKHLSQDGLIVVVLAVDKAGQVVSGPDIISRGFVYVRESENLMVELKDLISGTVMRWAASDNSEWHYIKNTLKDDIKDFVWEKTRRNPMILPIIMEV